MVRHLGFVIGLMLAAMLPGCGSMAPPGYPTAGDHIRRPAMPPLADAGPDLRPAPVFGTPTAYTGSALEDVGRRGLFTVHGPRANEIAILPSGDDSFAVRVQLLAQARTSIRIQALIFAGDEAGIHIADILKQKKAQGLDVRVIVDAPSNLGLQTQWMYFDLKQHVIEVQGCESLYLEWLNEVPLPFMSPARDPEAPNNRYHEKLWIVDGETDRGAAVVGGLNVADEYFQVDSADPDRNWRGQDIVVRGTLVVDMVAAFDRNFDHFVAIKHSRGILNTDLYWAATRDFLDEFGKLAVPYTTRADLVVRVEHMAGVKPALDFTSARSEHLNSEKAVVFESDNLATRLTRIFYENDLAYNRRVTPTDARNYHEPDDALYKLRK